MAKKTARKPRSPRPKQQYLDPDLAPPSNPALDLAADLYVARRDDRMAALRLEIQSKAALLELMQANHLHQYTTPDGYVVERDIIEGLKVRRKKTEENGEE